MSKLSIEEIRRLFETSKEFNEIFDAFEHAIKQRYDDIGLYRLLFWNSALKPEELCLFGEKLAKEFQHLSYDAYMWLANVFEATQSTYDNYELALRYYKKSASVKPDKIDPYINAADCYEPDLNIPPINILIDFLKQGANTIPQPIPIHEKLATLYEIAGNDEMSKYYKRKAQEGKPPAPEQTPSE